MVRAAVLSCVACPFATVATARDHFDAEAFEDVVMRILTALYREVWCLRRTACCFRIS
jgi:hypothetical protein